MKRVIGLLGGVLVGVLLVSITGCATPQTGTPAIKPAKPKIKVAKLDDLPQHTYPYKGDVTRLVQSRPQVLELARKVRADVQADLDTYEIDDAPTLRDLYGRLAVVHLLEKNYDAALEMLDRARALETKEAARLMSGLTTRATIAAHREVGEQAADAAFRQVFARHLAKALQPLPWDVVQDEVQELKGRHEMITESLVLGALGSRLQPAVDRTGELDAGAASGLLNVHLTLTERLPLKDEIVAACQAYIEAHRQQKPDIWPQRAVALAPTDRGTPVLVSVWDSGTDPSVFDRQLWTNPNEEPDGQDNDNNGYIDDVHGIAYDVHAHRTTELLCPLGDAAGRVSEMMDYMKGLTDLQADIDSPEATALKRHLGSLQPADVPGFLEDLDLVGNYSHGTHVAGIMLAGNPFARLLIARLSYDHHTVPVARTPEWGLRDAAKCRDTVAYLQQHGVRVVNMSWGEAQSDAEDSLEKNGIGNSAEERRDLARQVFGLQKQGLYEAIRNAPEILFICAAGNEDANVEFDEFIPSSFDLPNLLVVGAVDQAGEPTSFTSFGRVVQVYASGFEVDSFVPGGQRMKMSGTSMASPNVANLAAKILALNPKLTPPQVIDIIKRGCDRRDAGDHSYLLLNPKQTLELLRTPTTAR